jgi:hypothetical protein
MHGKCSHKELENRSLDIKKIYHMMYPIVAPFNCWTTSEIETDISGESYYITTLSLHYDDSPETMYGVVSNSCQKLG